MGRPRKNKPEDASVEASSKIERPEMSPKHGDLTHAYLVHMFAHEAEEAAILYKDRMGKPEVIKALEEVES